jgi:hypothetical protein
MPSTLELHKQSVIAVQNAISDIGGLFSAGNIGDDDRHPVGTFAPIVTLDMWVINLLTGVEENFHYYGIIPIQRGTVTWKDGTPAADNNYHHHRYRRRLLHHVPTNKVYYQEMRDMEQFPGYEHWVSIFCFDS